MRNSKEIVINDFNEFKNSVISEGNIKFFSPKFYRNEVFNEYDSKKELETKKILYNKKQAYKLLSMLQPASTQCFIYGSQFTDDCYYGDGKEIKKFLRKSRRVYELDLNQDVWNGCANFWISNDCHKDVPRWHTTGDIYFVVDINNFDWERFFENFNSNGTLSKLKSTLVSTAGFNKVKTMIEENEDIVIIEFIREVVISSEKNLSKLAKIAYTHGSYDIKGVSWDLKNKIILDL